MVAKYRAIYCTRSERICGKHGRLHFYDGHMGYHRVSLAGQGPGSGGQGHTELPVQT